MRLFALQETVKSSVDVSDVEVCRMRVNSVLWVDFGYFVESDLVSFGWFAIFARARVENHLEL